MGKVLEYVFLLENISSLLTVLFNMTTILSKIAENIKFRDSMFQIRLYTCIRFHFQI